MEIKIEEIRKKYFLERWSPKKLWKLGYGICKDDHCVFSHYKTGKQVSYKYWRYDDGRYACPCGYGIAPHKPLEED